MSKVFFNDAFEEWYVADSVEDAHAAWIDYQKKLGLPTEVFPDEPVTVADWTPWPDDKNISIYLDDGRGEVTKTAAGWAKETPRGILCSVDY